MTEAIICDKCGESFQRGGTYLWRWREVEHRTDNKYRYNLCRSCHAKVRGFIE